MNLINFKNGPRTAAKDSEDETLIRSSQKGDKIAFGYLVQRYMKRAYFTALGLTGDSQAALDLSQEAFVRAYRSIKSFQPGLPFFSWYYRILRNLALNFLRRKNIHARPFSEIGETKLEQMPDASDSAQKRLEKRELQEAVWQAIQELKPGEREILILREFEELSYREIAAVLQISMGTVMSRLYHARQSLKLRLQGLIDEYIE